MHLVGRYQFTAPASQIWSILMDPDTLANITPGITRLERQDEENFTSFADVKIGPVRGTFQGEVHLRDTVEPKSFSLKVQQNSKIGNVAADVQIQLEEVSDGETLISFEGEAILSGLMARTGQRVLSGVTRTLTAQFFKALEEEIINQNKSKISKKSI